MKKNKALQIVIVAVLLIVVLGSFTGVFRSVDVQPKPNTQEPKTVKISDAVMKGVVSSTLPSGYTFLGSGVAQLTKSPQEDIVICGESKNAKEVYMAVVEPSISGGSNILASLSLPVLDTNRPPCSSDSNSSSSQQRIVDVDNDGIKELVMNIGGGGASTDSFGIFKLNLADKKILHTSMKDPDGNITPTELLSGSSVTHSDAFDFSDVDGDGKQELIIFNSLLNNQDAPKNPKSWDWHMEVYKWNDSLFAYDSKLTASNQQLLSEFQKAELRNIK